MATEMLCNVENASWSWSREDLEPRGPGAARTWCHEDLESLEPGECQLELEPVARAGGTSWNLENASASWIWSLEPLA